MRLIFREEAMTVVLVELDSRLGAGFWRTSIILQIVIFVNIQNAQMME
jgi:hypothetical protein